MKTVLFVALFLLLSATAGFAGETKELKWLSFDSAKTVAAKEKKKILLDVYTDWCKWCKKMDQDTYNDPKVLKYLNEKYVVAKINPEQTGNVSYKGKTVSNNDFAQSMGVKGYPTILFFDQKGEIITGLSSYLKADDFMNVARFIGENKYQKMKWEEYQKEIKK